MKNFDEIKEFEDIDSYYGISKMVDEIKEFEDIDTYYGISDIVSEVFKDRVEAHKHLVTANKEIKRLNDIINRAIEYIKAVGVKPKEIDSFVLLDILKGSDKE